MNINNLFTDGISVLFSIFATSKQQKIASVFIKRKNSLSRNKILMIFRKNTAYKQTSVEAIHPPTEVYLNSDRICINPLSPPHPHSKHRAREASARQSQKYPPSKTQNQSRGTSTYPQYYSRQPVCKRTRQKNRGDSQI